MNQLGDIGQFLDRNGDKMEENFEKALGFDLEEWAESKNGGMKYLRTLEALGHSDAVMA